MNPSMQKMVEDLLNSMNVPPETRDAVIAAMSDPAKVDEAIGQLKAISTVGSDQPLNIEDYYKLGFDKYQLHWPLGPTVPLPMPFDRLSRKVQFFVLFQEWTQRNLAGMTLLNSGDVAGAEAVFQECLKRARQIDVHELEARSYEGFMRVAEMRGDRSAQLAWLAKAASARQT
jgi:hypothetical protein